MKKVLAIILMALAVTAVFVSCDDPKHEHSYDVNDWKSDSNNHWHVCTTCNEKLDVAEHTFGDWTLSEDGTQVIRLCTVCKYKEIKTVSTWDGTSVDTSWYEGHEGEDKFTLTSAAQLAGLVSLVNGGTGESNLSNGVAFSGVTINLAVDIDLNNQDWTPIGLYHNISDTDFTKKEFSGTFDGQNHTISGLMISCDNGKSSYRALFGYVKDGTIKNLTVEGTVNACDSAGVVGALCGGTIENVTNEVNVSVSKATPQGTGDKANEKPQAKVAGIVVTVKDGNESTITNCRNEGVISSTATEGTSAVGGIVAWSMTKKLTVTDCTNSGNVSTAGTQWAGGILGYVRQNSVNTTVSNCTNTGTVTAGTDITAGGIIGQIVKGAKGTKSGNTAGTGYEEVGGDKNDFVSPDSN